MVEILAHFTLKVVGSYYVSQHSMLSTYHLVYDVDITPMFIFVVGTKMSGKSLPWVKNLISTSRIIEIK